MNVQDMWLLVLRLVIGAALMGMGRAWAVTEAITMGLSLPVTNMHGGTVLGTLTSAECS